MAREEKNQARRNIWQFIQFNLVGAVNSIIDFVVYWLLNLLFHWTYAAQVISYLCGMANSYLMNSSWTFRENRTRSIKEILSFVGVNLVSMGVSLGGIWFFKNIVGITNEWVSAWMPAFLYTFFNGDTISKIFATFFAMLVNYFGSKLFVFTKRAPSAAREEGEGHAGQNQELRP